MLMKLKKLERGYLLPKSKEKLLFESYWLSQRGFTAIFVACSIADRDRNGCFVRNKFYATRQPFSREHPAKCSPGTPGPSGSVNPVRIYSKIKRLLLTPKSKPQRGCCLLLQKLLFESYWLSQRGSTAISVDLTNYVNQC